VALCLKGYFRLAELQRGYFFSTQAFAALPTFTDFPNIGADNHGVEYLITANPNGTFTTTLNPAYGGVPTPYDGIEDTYFGFVNNSGDHQCQSVIADPADHGLRW